MEGEFILWKRLSCLVCLRCHDDQSIIQDEPEPSVLSLPDCICLCLFVPPSSPPPPPPPAANGNDTKKFKGDVRTSGVPSRVVHVRKLPNDINEAEVIGLGLPFGKVTNLLMLKGKNQVRTCRFSQLGGAGISFLTHWPHLETLTMALLSHPHEKDSDCSCWNSMEKSISFDGLHLRCLHNHSSEQQVKSEKYKTTVKCLFVTC